jgi:T4-like virus tail tube protein gp19
MPSVPSSTGGGSILVVDGVTCGQLLAVGGGAIAADVVIGHGPGPFADKHIGGVRYEPIELTVDLSLDKLLYGWIADSWKMNYSRRDGTVVETDTTGKARAEHDFFHALISEVTVPEMDAAAKQPAHLTVKIAPEFTRRKKGSGTVLKVAKPQRQQWLASNFKLEIDGIDASKVTTIDSFTVTQELPKDRVGDTREPLIEPTSIEFPNLRVTVAASGADTWRSWFDTFVINRKSKEKNGNLTFLSSDLKTRLGSISLHNVGIFRLEEGSRVTGTDMTARVVATLYCESMELSVP